MLPLTMTPAGMQFLDDVSLWATLSSPLGQLLVVVSDVGVQRIDFIDKELAGQMAAHQKAKHQAEKLDKQRLSEERPCPLLVQAMTQLSEYFDGRRTDFSLPLDLVGTEFQREAWHALGTIPYGKTITYGEQAARINRARAVRAIGVANSKNPVAIVVPCHRVIGADGSLTGYAGGVEKKKWLLDHEQTQWEQTQLEQT